MLGKVVIDTMQNKVNVVEFTIRARNRDELINKVISLYKFADYLQKRSGIHNIFTIEERNEYNSYNQVWLLIIKNHLMSNASVMRILY